MSNNQIDFTISPVTNQGAKKQTVWFRDKLTGNYLHQKEVTKAFIAKMYHQQRISHAIDSIPVVDL